LILRSVGQRSRTHGPGTEKSFPDDNLRTLGLRITKLNREVDHDQQVTLLILRSVGQWSRSQWPGTAKICPEDNLRMLGPGITKLKRDVYHDQQMIPIDFEVNRSKIKVNLPKNSRTLVHSDQIISVPCAITES